MATHKAIVTDGEGKIFVKTDVVAPAPAAGEVQIKVDSGVLGPFDTYQVDNKFFVYNPPVILGLAGSGTIAKVGEGVKGLAIGDRVAFGGFQGGPDKSLQEIVTLADDKVGKLPSSISLEEAASIPDNFITAWFTLTNSLGISLSLSTPPSNPAEPILIFGSGSSVGQYAIQVLKATGFTQIIATASPKHHDYLRKLGAAHVFDYNKPDSLTEGILKASNGAKIKFVFDCVTTESSMAAIASVVDQSSKVGFLLPVKKSVVGSSELLTSIPDDKNPYPKDVAVATSTFLYRDQSPELKDHIMSKTFATLVANGGIKPNQVKVFDQGTLEKRAEEAFDALKKGSFSGSRIIIKIAGSA